MRIKYFIGVFGLAWATLTWAQSAAPAVQADTSRATVLPDLGKPNTAAANPAAATEGDDFELETIEIQAVVEKPNVDIIPKRTKPEWEETRFIDRSFEAELKRAPKDLMIVDEELDRAQKLDALKKVETKKKP